MNTRLSLGPVKGPYPSPTLYINKGPIMLRGPEAWSQWNYQ